MKKFAAVLASCTTLVALTAVAQATETTTNSTPVTVFDNVSIVNIGGAVFLRRGATTTHLVQGEFVTAPVIERATRKISFATVDFCDRPLAIVVMNFDQLSARLDNVAAYRLHKQKKFTESKAAFAKALALDPSNRTIAVNLASAQQLLGETPAALKTLAPWLASEPVAMYATIAVDPELVPLLASPEVLALKAKRPGNVVVTKAGLKGGIAYSAERNLLAVERDECSWGRDRDADFDACSKEIEVFDAATGKQVTAVRLAWFDRSNKALFTRRIKAAQLALRDFGFTSEALVRGKNIRTEADQDQEKYRFSFASLKVGAVGSGGTARVVRGNTVVAEGITLDRLTSVAWVPTAKAFVIASLRPGREGCEDTDPTRTTVMPATLSK
ncbi:MAG: hypothetical protein KBG15_05900 [Kofleriaceae bacterium]|nr:hypothetical protein [Kofleriaceae bacterium]